MTTKGLIDLSCPPVPTELCSEQGVIVMAVAYLDAHYQTEPLACNNQVVIPWVWQARFAAELTYQSATKAILDADGKDYKIPRTHKFADLHSQWVDALKNGQKASRKNSFQTRAKGLRRLWRPIEDVDTNGLMLRYPLGHPEQNVPPVPAGFDEHCGWPLELRQLIALVCDITVDRLPDKAEPCRNRLRFLRCTAGAGICLGDYSDQEIGRINSLHEFGELLTRDIDHFSQPVEFGWADPPTRFVYIPELDVQRLDTD